MVDLGGAPGACLLIIAETVCLIVCGCRHRRFSLRRFERQNEDVVFTFSFFLYFFFSVLTEVKFHIGYIHEKSCDLAKVHNSPKK